MAWVWLPVVLILWTVTALAVIALCVSVRQIDARLGRDRKGARMSKAPKPHTRVEVE